MKKNLLLLGLLVFIFAGCDTGTGSGTKDTWSEITSMHQLDGTWVGTQTQTVPLKDILEASGLLKNPEMIGMIAGLLGIPPAMISPGMITPEMIAVFIKDIKVKIVVDATITFAADNDDEGTMSVTMNATVSLFGENIETVWPLLMIMDKNMFEDMLPFDGIIDIDIDDDNHTITMEAEEPPTDITLETIAARFEINQTGTKLKADTSIGGGIIPSEVTFTKVE